MSDTPDATKKSGTLVKVTTEDELRQTIAAAKGPVVLSFEMQGCEACDEQKPEIEALVQRCGDVTVIRADVDELPSVADAYGCEATPTLYFADKAADMEPGKAKEVDDVSKLKRKIKCAR